MANQSRLVFLKSISGSNVVQHSQLTTADTNQPEQQPPCRYAATSLSPYKGEWGQKQILHLLRRTLTGVSPADLAHFSRLSLADALQVLLSPPAPPQPPVNVYNDSSYTDPEIAFGKTWIHAGFGDTPGETDSRRVSNLKGWLTGLLLSEQNSVRGKMFLFWSNHLSAQMYVMKDARLDYLYASLIYHRALGNFKQLVLDMTLNPGMLEYLNTNVNTAKAPNENYARELQELFTIGKGPGSHYTEHDVKQAARILTGWTTNDNEQGVVNIFLPERHDTGDKQFSAFYNHRVIKGRQGADAGKEVEELIDMLFEQHEVAMFFCRNIYRWFVYYHFDPLIEKNVIEPLAKLFIESNYEVTPVLKALLGSEHFFDPLNMGCQVKNPVDHLLGTCRALGITGTATTMQQQYKEWQMLAYRLKTLGMDICDPPNVAGWPAYYQVPSFAETWINSTTLTLRNAATDELAGRSGITDGNATVQANLTGFTAALSNPANADSLIADATTLLLAAPVSEIVLHDLKQILLSGQKSDYYWQQAWRDYAANPQKPEALNTVLNRLVPFYTYLMQRAEYQLC